MRDDLTIVREDISEIKDDIKEGRKIVNENTRILAQNTESLKQHMQRTVLLEKSVEKLDQRSYNLSIRLYILVGVITAIQGVIITYLIKSIIG